MPKAPKKPAVSENKQNPGTNNNKMKCNRRDFLKTMTAAGGSALLLSPANALAYKKLTGYPNSFGMLTDLSACVGCRSCEEACNRANNLPAPKVPFDDKSVFEKKRHPTARAYTIVNRYGKPEIANGPIYRKVQCNHCNEPSCASACPVRAYTKTPEGAVLYNQDVCFGCRYCMIACPYYAPAYDYESAFEPRIVKCTFCYERLKMGGMPACAEACPVQAITFGKKKKLIKLGRKKISKNPEKYLDHIYGEHEAGGTSWLYISNVPFKDLGFPTNLPDEPLVEQTKGFLSSVPLVLVIWPAVLGMCYSAMKRREQNPEVSGTTQLNGKEDEK